MARAALLIALLASVVACSPRGAATPSPTLAGTDLGGGQAPQFTLVDGLTGQSVSLASLRGRVVALAFLYTQCPDVCPLTAQRFAQSQRELGSDAAEVAFVAVSVDPERDTPQAVREFTRAQGPSQGWHYLIGPRAQLVAVWDAYGVGVRPDASAKLSHNDAVFLIDRRQRERVLTHSSDLADTLTRDLRTLVAEPR